MKWRLVRAISIVLGVLLIALGGGAWVLGSILIEPDNHAVQIPAGFAVKVVAIPGPEHAVAGWWLDAGPSSPVVLLVHGMRADRSSMVPRAQLLSRHGFSVLLIDLQAHGDTPGEAITLGYRESADIVAARNWIKKEAPGRKIGVIGCSLGGAAVLLAPQPVGFDAMVLEAVYPRIGRAVEDRIRIRMGALAPLLAPLLLVQLQPRLHISPSQLEPIRSMGKLGAPVLVVAGSEDRHTTLAESAELYAAATQPKSLWILKGAQHEDFLQFDPNGYDAKVVGFLTTWLMPRPVSLASQASSARRYPPRNAGTGAGAGDSISKATPRCPTGWSNGGTASGA